MKKRIPFNISKAINEFLVKANNMFGDRAKKIILYGSYARGDFNKSSDIDIMILTDLTDDEIYKKIMSYETGIVTAKNNRKRNIRLLQKLEAGFSTFTTDFRLLYDDVIFIGLTADRNILYDRINRRLDNMAIDLIDEVKPYYMKNIKTKALMNGIGYKELYPFFANEQSLRSCVEKIKQNSRNYAKRQYTWFQNQMDISWFDVCYDNFSKTIDEVGMFIEEYMRSK